MRGKNIWLLELQRIILGTSLFKCHEFLSWYVILETIQNLCSIKSVRFFFIFFLYQILSCFFWPCGREKKKQWKNSQKTRFIGSKKVQLFSHFLCNFHLICFKSGFQITRARPHHGQTVPWYESTKSWSQKVWILYFLQFLVHTFLWTLNIDLQLQQEFICSFEVWSRVVPRKNPFHGRFNHKTARSCSWKLL